MEDSLDGLPPAIAVERSGPEIPPATIMEEIESQDAWIAVQEDPHACCICFDSFESPVLLSCGQGHFLCDKDIHQVSLIKLIFLFFLLLDI